MASDRWHTLHDPEYRRSSIMSSFLKQTVVGVVASGALLWAAAPAVRAQASMTSFRVNPGMSNQSPTDIGAAMGSTAGVPAGFRTVPIVNSFAPTNVYPIYPDPYGGGLSGAADAIAAQGQYQIQMQQSRLINQQVEQSKIDTRRKQLDEWQYERSITPTLEDQREYYRIQELRRARNNPPLNEIWNGTALNSLLLPIQQMMAKGVPGPTIPLDPNALKHINVSGGVTSGGIGILKQGQDIQWPLPLRRGPFEKDRKRVQELVNKAIEQASSGSQVDADTLDNLTATIANMRAEVRADIEDMTPSENVRANRTLNELDSSVRLLQDPNASNYLTRKWSAQGNTVGELVYNMTQGGLKFAPATAGDETAYTALHSAMVAFLNPGPSVNWDPMRRQIP
jgi:hypothetical protein